MNDIVHRNHPPLGVSLNFFRPWHVLIPPLYRYLPSEYVTKFFDTGELRLSSFSCFSKHKDEARGDKEEGKSLILAQAGDKFFGHYTIAGLNSYVLCGSHVLSKNVMNDFSHCDAAIEITNTVEFASEIARQLAGFKAGVSGNCIYTN